MSRLQLLICIGVLCLQVVLLASSQENCEFIMDPMDNILDVNDTDVLLTCTPALDVNQLINWEIYLQNGTFWTVSGADAEVQRLRGFEFTPVNQSLRIIRVQSFHAGLYRCRGIGVHLTPACVYHSNNATITVRAGSFLPTTATDSPQSDGTSVLYAATSGILGALVLISVVC